MPTRSEPLRGVEAVLCDLDGTLYVGDRVLPGAVEAIARLRAAGVRLAFVTNTTTTPRDALHEKVTRLGLPVEREEIFSALGAGARHLRSLGRPRCHFVLRDEALADFAGLEHVDDHPDVVVIGDVGDAWTFARMQKLFRMVTGGARILALHKGRAYETADGLRIDVGAFVAGLEYATGVEATVVGKPAHTFFELALDALGVAPPAAIMVGDDVRSDVGGAQAAGLLGALVRTGKFREADLGRAEVTPDVTLASIADLPAALGH